MGQGHGGRHGDEVAAEQRQVHARAPLGDAVAHGGHAAGDLGCSVHLAHGIADETHYAALAALGVSAAQWKAAELRLAIAHAVAGGK